MYGAPTAKRHVGWSNCRTIKLLDLGRMIRKIHNKKGGIKSTKTSQSRRGKKSFSGSKFLKSTGPLVQFGSMLFNFVFVGWCCFFYYSIFWGLCHMHPCAKHKSLGQVRRTYERIGPQR